MRSGCIPMKKTVILKDSNSDHGWQRTPEALFHALKEGGYESDIVNFEISMLVNEKEKWKDALFFNTVVGKMGAKTQAIVAAVLQSLGYDFVGSSSKTHFLCLDKSITKAILKEYGIPTPRFDVFDGSRYLLQTEFDVPVFIKPSSEGSGIGINENSLIMKKDLISSRVQKLYERFHQKILVEEHLPGREFTVGIIGNAPHLTVLPILEIDLSDLPEGVEKYYSERVKEDYADETRYFCPANLPFQLYEEIRDITYRTFEVLECRDFARIDFRLDSQNKPYVIEVNSLPGLDPINSDLPKMAKAMNSDYKDLVIKITQVALSRISKG